MEILSDYVDGVTRIEAEGLYIVGDEIYSLFVTDGVGSATSKTAGLVIFKEFSTDDDAIDFSPSATVYPTYYREQSEGGVFPEPLGERCTTLIQERNLRQ